MSLERIIRKLLVYKGDVNAVRRGKVGRRFARRVYGKATSRLARKLLASSAHQPRSPELPVRGPFRVTASVVGAIFATDSRGELPRAERQGS